MSSMAKYDSAVIEKYRQLLKKDPSSLVFAPLSDAYRESGDLSLAERTVREGLRRHPEFASGHLVLAKILKDQKKLQEALTTVQKASQISAENISAHQLEGDLLLELKRPQEALRAYKMVLFLNPQSVKARKVVQKLESLTAIDYEDDVFAMTKLESIESLKSRAPAVESSISKSPPEVSAISGASRSLQRILSLLDAFIVRNELSRAHEILTQAKSEFGSQIELDQRERLLRSRTQTSLLTGNEQASAAEIIQPRMSREREVAHRKLEKLRMLLRKIEDIKSPV